MRTLVLILAVAGSLTTGSALAQTQHPAKVSTAAPPAAGQAETTAQQHDRCKAVMDGRMAPRRRHDHQRDKTGAITPPKPLSEAEMDRLHRECAALMGTAQAADAEK